MRLWSLHPRYLDAAGLVALWREALLARAVLRGETIGYRHHPQLIRFRACRFPRSAINAYLRAIHDEAVVRGYAFDRSKLARIATAERIVTTRGQLDHEWSRLLAKLRRRSPAVYRRHRHIAKPAVHPLFAIVEGPVCDWERAI
jgi:Pyrimidine dimer DNA glycosylase